jgi:hypothetical protein
MTDMRALPLVIANELQYVRLKFANASHLHWLIAGQRDLRDMVMRTLAAVLCPGLMLLAFVSAARAADEPFTLTLKDHRFEPTVIEIPAGKKVKLVVRNLDTTPEEFDSAALNREKVIAGGGEGTIWIGPLDAGTYDFIGEYHADTAKGQVIAK